MELRVLRYFLTVAQEESISAAAEVLHVTQPTLSRQLMELEAELGTKLFARGRKKRRMALTEAGSRLRWQAEEILALADKTLASFQGGTEEVAGEVAIGGGESREYDLRDGAKTWWEEEMPSAGEMTQGLETLAAAGNQVDFILTHEPSARARGYLAGRNDRLDGVNVYLNRVEEIASYKRWFFGSLHMDKTMSKQHVAVFQTVVPVVESHAKRK